MNLLIRLFTPDDYPMINYVLNAVYPEYPGMVEELRFHDKHRDTKCKFQRWVAERDERVVAVGTYGQSADMYHPRKFWLHVAVHPDHQCQGLGSALYNHLIEVLKPFDPLSVQAGAREDRTHSVQFLKHRGFQEVMRTWRLRLDVASFDLAPYAGVDERMRAQGIEIKTLKELEVDPERNHKLYELECELLKDVPYPDEQTQVSYDYFIETTLNDPTFLPEAYFVAVLNGEYVGMSALWSSHGNDELYTTLTGIKHAYRRRGIALALKLHGIIYAKSHAHPVIKTWNESNNRAILSINERLGFVKQPAWISFVKVFKEEER